MKWVKQAIHYWCKDILSGMYLGSGICAAILDTGISPHPDLHDHIAAFRDFTGNSLKYRDDSGHGTHVAGILAGSGRSSGGIYSGIAPETELLIGKVLDREGNGNVDNVINGIRWIMESAEKYKVRIVNISVGTQPGLARSQKDRLQKAVEDLWDMGLIVVVSAGNYGPGSGTVVVPGNSRKVITVGVPDSPGVFSGTRRDRINYSGRGPTDECIIKPDIFAPGTGILSCNSRFSFPGESAYIMKSGTSMATPVVSGALSCLLSKFPGITNAEAKLRLRNSCEKIPGTESGWGFLNVEKLLRA